MNEFEKIRENVKKIIKNAPQMQKVLKMAEKLLDYIRKKEQHIEEISTLTKEIKCLSKKEDHSAYASFKNSMLEGLKLNKQSRRSSDTGGHRKPAQQYLRTNSGIIPCKSTDELRTSVLKNSHVKKTEQQHPQKRDSSNLSVTDIDPPNNSTGILKEIQDIVTSNPPELTHNFNIRNEEISWENIQQHEKPWRTQSMICAQKKLLDSIYGREKF